MITQLAKQDPEQNPPLKVGDPVKWVNYVQKVDGYAHAIGIVAEVQDGGMVVIAVSR